MIYPLAIIIGGSLGLIFGMIVWYGGCWLLVKIIELFEKEQK